MSWEGQGGEIFFFSLLHVSSNFKTKLFNFFLQKSTNTFCFVIANLGRLVAAKMRLSINCIEFAYSRPIVYPRPSLAGICFFNLFMAKTNRGNIATDMNLCLVVSTSNRGNIWCSRKRREMARFPCSLDSRVYYCF